MPPNWLRQIALLFCIANPTSVSARYAEQFLQTVSFETSETIVGLVYGNDLYGYFESSEINQTANGIAAQFIPPGYRFPINLYLRKQTINGHTELVDVGTRRFSFPLNETIVSLPGTEVQANLSSSYFSVSQFKLGSEADQSLSVVTLNRFGEVVWAYGLDSGMRIVTCKPLDSGRFALIGENQVFQIIDFRGQIESSVTWRGTGLTHHDFWFEEGEPPLVFGQSTHRYAGAVDSNLPPGRYLASTIIRLDPQTQTPHIVWDAFLDGPMLHGPEWIDDLPEQDPTSVRGFDHMNTISRFPGQGYLLSWRNFHSLIYLDENFRMQWSLGSAPGVTITSRGTNFEFYRQHHPTFLNNGNVLLLDNGRETSRVLEIAIDPQAHTAHLVKEFIPSPPVYAPIRGTTFRLDNGRTLAAFPNSVPGNKLRLIEFDDQGNQSGSLELPSRVGAEVTRVFPMNTIGGEKYLGTTPR